MSEFDQIQQLIRLKRHEQPSPDFVDDFVRTFHQRQRAELLQQSARGLLWERITTYFEDLMTPKHGWAFASALAVAALVFTLKPTDTGKGQIVSSKPGAASVVPVNAAGAQEVPKADERYLIAGHYKGGLGDELNASPKNSALQPQLPANKPQGSLLPAGFSADVQSR